VVVILLVVPAHILGEFYQLDPLAGFAPSAHFVHWFGGARDLPLYPALAVYGFLGAGSFLSFRRRMVRREKVVDQKLEQMGVSR
jgi:hypothetical protein